MEALGGDADAAGGTATVLVARDGRVEERRLRLGLRTLDAAEVLEGLAAGDVVLLGPAPAPGRRVQRRHRRAGRSARRQGERAKTSARR